MSAFDEARINSKIKASLGVQHIRIQIEQAEAELERAHTALADLPASVRYELLTKQEERFEALLQREQQLLVQARRTAVAELKAERVESLRIEAAPLLERAQKNLDFVRESLAKVLSIEAEARANGGNVMSEALDKSAIGYFIPSLSYDQARGTWLLKR